MPGTNQYSSVTEQPKDKNDPAASTRRQFDAAIKIMEGFEVPLSDEQKRIPQELNRLRLITALKALSEKVANDVKNNPLLATKAKAIALSTQNLTRDLTDRNLDIDKKYQAIQKFQQVACPIAPATIFGAMVGAAIGAVFRPFDAFENRHAYDVIAKALDFAPKPELFVSNMMGLGLFSQKASSNQSQEVTVTTRIPRSFKSVRFSV